MNLKCFWCNEDPSKHLSKHCESCGFSHSQCGMVPKTGDYEDMINKRGRYAPKKMRMMEGGCSCDERSSRS